MSRASSVSTSIRALPPRAPPLPTSAPFAPSPSRRKGVANQAASRPASSDHASQRSVSAPCAAAATAACPGATHLAQHRWIPLEREEKRPSSAPPLVCVAPATEAPGPRSPDAGACLCTCGGDGDGAVGLASRGLCAAAPAGGCRGAPRLRAHTVRRCACTASCALSLALVWC